VVHRPSWRQGEHPDLTARMGGTSAPVRNLDA
jgi:hypothetical protein